MSTQRNNYYYYDDYMYFSFNGIHSSKYNLIIQNDLEDLKLNISTGAKLEFASPKYQTGQHLLGVSRPQRSFPSLKLVAQGLTRSQCVEMVKWLKPGIQGFLKFDYASDWEYDVVVNSLSDPNLYMQDDGTYIVALEVNFVTTTTYMAHNAYIGYCSSVKSYPDYISGAEYYMGDIVKYGNITYMCMVDKTKNAPGSNTEWEEYEINSKAGLYNNDLCIPCMNIDTTVNGVLGVTLYHLGDSHTEFIFNHNFVPTTEEGSTSTYGLLSYNLEVALPTFFEEQSSTLNITLNDNQAALPQNFEYNGAANSFYVNSYIPQLTLISGAAKTVKSIYSYKPLSFTSPGAPIKIQNNEHLAELMATPYEYVIFKPGQFGENNEFAQVTGCYPRKVTTQAELVSPSLDVGQSYDGYYFVYCSKFYISYDYTTQLAKDSLEVFIDGSNSSTTATTNEHHTLDNYWSISVRSYTEVV